MQSILVQNFLYYKMSIFLRKKLLEWYNPDERNLPWKKTKDPYKIWLSEIILQQTRVEQGRPYYLKFISKYPSIKSFAEAPLSEILKLWEGLGYYSRARNMHAAAQQVMETHNGQFPSSYDELIKLKGIGSYSAAAISSFAIDACHPVLDGNVFRVLSRFFNIDTPIDTSEGKKLFYQLAMDCIDQAQPAKYNQAIMDFGALICKPKNPNCAICPLQLNCSAFFNKTISNLPKKSKKLTKKNRYFMYFVVQKNEKIAIQKREEKDIWRELNEFPMLEFDSIDKLFENNFYKNNKNNIIELSQVLTHQIINAFFIYVDDLPQTNKSQKEIFWINSVEIRNFVFPKIICQFLDGNFN